MIPETLTDQFRRRLHYTKTDFTRGLMREINWDDRLIGLKGARGVGKTTLLLQYIKLELNDKLEQTLYVSLDHFWFAENRLFDLAEDFSLQGGKFLFVDEVHKYPDWSLELKLIYDTFPGLKVVFTGSSLLEILNARADLSRRAVVYTMQGLSFREYLEIKTGQSFDVQTLDYILSDENNLSSTVLEVTSPVGHFKQYLKKGYYPFFLEGEISYLSKINEVANLILEIELPLLRKVDSAYIPRIKQLLYILAESVPFKPNVTKLSERIGIKRNTLVNYLHYLEEVKLTINLHRDSLGISKLQKPLKIYLENPNLMYAIKSEQIDIGTLRETFFLNQTAYQHQVTYPEKGDFYIQNHGLFEVGGKNKTRKQLQGTENGYLALDDIEFKNGNKIPLWHFGFLY